MNVDSLIVRYKTLILVHERKLETLREVRHRWKPNNEHKGQRRETDRKINIQYGLICQLREIVHWLQRGQVPQLLEWVKGTDAYLSLRVAGDPKSGKARNRKEHYSAMHDQLRMVIEDLQEINEFVQEMLI